MESLIKAWIVFLFVSFAISVLTMSYVQIRAAGRHGWRGLAHRRLFDTYWRELSGLERSLLWLGLGVFAVTFLASAVSVLLWPSRP